MLQKSLYVNWISRNHFHFNFKHNYVRKSNEFAKSSKREGQFTSFGNIVLQLCVTKYGYSRNSIECSHFSFCFCILTMAFLAGLSHDFRASCISRPTLCIVIVHKLQQNAEHSLYFYDTIEVQITKDIII